MQEVKLVPLKKITPAMREVSEVSRQLLRQEIWSDGFRTVRIAHCLRYTDEQFVIVLDSGLLVQECDVEEYLEWETACRSLRMKLKHRGFKRIACHNGT